MHVTPWIASVANIEAELDRLIDHRRPTGAKPWRGADRMLDELIALVEPATHRLPRLHRVPDESVDRAVGRILSALLDGEVPPEDVVQTADERVELTSGSVRVLLGDPANWYVLFPWVAEELRNHARRCQKYQRRLEFVNADVIAQTFSDVAESIRDLAKVFDYRPTARLWLDPPHSLIDADFEQIEAVLERAIVASRDQNKQGWT